MNFHVVDQSVLDTLLHSRALWFYTESTIKSQRMELMNTKYLKYIGAWFSYAKSSIGDEGKIKCQEDRIHGC